MITAHLALGFSGATCGLSLFQMQITLYRPLHVGERFV
jgi:hypothetical protein